MSGTQPPRSATASPSADPCCFVAMQDENSNKLHDMAQSIAKHFPQARPEPCRSEELLLLLWGGALGAGAAAACTACAAPPANPGPSLVPCAGASDELHSAQGPEG